MQNPAELFDIVDERDRVLGQAPRAEVHARRLRHRAVHIFLFNRQGQLYIQQRALTKDTSPGCFDSSASGHLDAGEDYDHAARRELHEELGLAVPPEKLTRALRLEACAETGWEFVWLYTLTGDFEPTPNPREISAGHFWDRDRILRLIEEQPAASAPAFRLIFREFCGRGLWPAR